VRSSFVVQPWYTTPIKLYFEKCSTAGIRGMDSASCFRVKHDEAAGLFCAVCGGSEQFSGVGDSGVDV
jgi:hypothetical protein